MIVFCFVIYASPFVFLVTGFAGSLIFIQRISNQWASNEQIVVVFLATVLGTIAGGFIGYFLCPNKTQSGGWAWNFSPCFYIYFGQFIGVTIIPLLMSYFLATTQQWVNNLWPSSEQIFLILLLIILAVIAGLLTYSQWLNRKNAS